MRKGNVKSDPDKRGRSDTLLMGGRLRSERERLHLDLPNAARLMGVSEEVLSGLEGSSGSTQFASGLTLLAHAGYDILFIVTGIRNEVGKADGRAPGDEVRHALGQMAGQDRQRLLLHLVTGELNQLLAQR